MVVNNERVIQLTNLMEQRLDNGFDKNALIDAYNAISNYLDSMYLSFEDSNDINDINSYDYSELIELGIDDDVVNDFFITFEKYSDKFDRLQQMESNLWNYLNN